MGRRKNTIYKHRHCNNRVYSYPDEFSPVPTWIVRIALEPLWLDSNCNISTKNWNHSRLWWMSNNANKRILRCKDWFLWNYDEFYQSQPKHFAQYLLLSILEKATFDPENVNVWADLLGNVVIVIYSFRKMLFVTF